MHSKRNIKTLWKRSCLSRSNREVICMSTRPRFLLDLFLTFLLLNPHLWPQRWLVHCKGNSLGPVYKCSAQCGVTTLKLALCCYSPDQKYYWKKVIKANPSQRQSFGQSFDFPLWSAKSAIWTYHDSCTVAKCLAGWSGIRKHRIRRMAIKDLGKRY